MNPARVRTAHRALLGDLDPAHDLLSDAVADLRLLGPGQPVAGWPHIIVVSGADDLHELRTVVETATGTGTWPASPDGDALTEAGYRCAGQAAGTVPVARSAALSGLLLAMENVIDDRSAWRTWRTAVDTLGPALGAVEQLTVQAERWERRGPAA